MGRETAKYLFRLDFMVLSVMFIAAFSVLFMIIYAPFSMAAWFDVTEEQPMFVTVAFYIVAVATMLLSKIALRWIVRRFEISTRLYILWLIAEAFVIAWLYIGFTRVILPETECSSEFVGRVFSCVVAILAIPYTMVSLYAAYRSQKEENAIIRYQKSLTESNVAPSNLINLTDENGAVKLTIDIDSLYYMESQDNYVKVYYDNEGVLSSYMLRSRTKHLEQMLASTPMQRCHRSFMINTTKINIVRNQKPNAVAILKHPNIKPIPISKSYYERIIAMVEPSQGAESSNNENLGGQTIEEKSGRLTIDELISDIKKLIRKYLFR